MNILLTFDYEVFFGENFYSEEEVLFRPTEKLLAIAKKHNAKLVFFIDICSIVAYEKFGRMEYVNNFQKQIYKILELGHDVQMHFHPHWFDSIYNMSSNSWHHNYKNWSYSNLIDNYGLTKANEMFGLAQRKFIDLVGSKPLSFRAGGYTTQPHEEALISLLKRFDYKYDSSITPLKMFHSSAQWFDYM
ncbi:hypothetical protein BZJ19_16960, partial [Salinivibrio proteolyticus]|uniref:hypothetical protein n=1 Tax=Salinivibrio proteolyticus TaxID=334715 RepID=UPI0009C7F832